MRIVVAGKIYLHTRQTTSKRPHTSDENAEQNNFVGESEYGGIKGQKGGISHAPPTRPMPGNPIGTGKTMSKGEAKQNPQEEENRKNK